MAILNNMLKGELIWLNYLWDIQVKKGCTFLRHPVYSKAGLKIIQILFMKHSPKCILSWPRLKGKVDEQKVTSVYKERGK